MTLQANIAADCGFFDGVQTVTLIQRRAGTTANRTVNNVTSGALSKRQLQALGGVALTGREKSWSLNVAEVGASGVEPGDTITDAASAINNILTAELATLGTRWKCVAVQRE